MSHGSEKHICSVFQQILTCFPLTPLSEVKTQISVSVIIVIVAMRRIGVGHAGDKLLIHTGFGITIFYKFQHSIVAPELLSTLVPHH